VRVAGDGGRLRYSPDGARAFDERIEQKLLSLRKKESPRRGAQYDLRKQRKKIVVIEAHQRLQRLPGFFEGGMFDSSLSNRAAPNL
jgi:hypothetical protein